MHVTRITVRSYELDSLGHVNHAVYLNWLEHARVRMLSDIGLTLDELFRRKWFATVVHVEVDYGSEARVGQALRIESETERLGRTSITFGQRILAEADDRLVAKGKVVLVMVGEDGKPIPVPQALLSAHATYVDGENRHAPHHPDGETG